jgi:hypothetical protein
MVMLDLSKDNIVARRGDCLDPVTVLLQGQDAP